MQGEGIQGLSLGFRVSVREGLRFEGSSESSWLKEEIPIVVLEGVNAWRCLRLFRLTKKLFGAGVLKVGYSGGNPFGLARARFRSKLDGFVPYSKRST